MSQHIRRIPNSRSFAIKSLAGTLCLGIVLSITACWTIIGAQDHIAVLTFEKSASESLQTIQMQLSNANGALYSLRDFFESTDKPVTSREFQAFAARLRERYEGLRDTGWAPTVLAKDRPTFEAEVRGAGFPNFAIKMKNASGGLIPVTGEGVRYPIVYANPIEVAAKVRGLDVGFEPIRQSAIEEAIRTQKTASTPPLMLVSGSGATRGYMSFLPVLLGGGSAAETRGLVFGVFDIKPMLEKVITASLASNDFGVYVYDPSEKPDEQFIHWHPGRNKDAAAAVIPSQSDLLNKIRWESPLQISNQTWRVVFVKPGALTAGFWSLPPLVTLAAGMTITGLIQACLIISMRRTAELEIIGQDLAEKGRQLEHLALYDPLTGLQNRRALSAVTIADAMRENAGGDIALLMLDLDRFKQVNDTLGHSAGDALLREVAARIRATVRAEDIVIRLGGDEFAIIQTSGQQPQSAQDLAAELVDTVCKPYSITNRSAEIGLSIGISIEKADRANLDAMLRESDLALYKAKNAGRGTWRFSAGETGPQTFVTMQSAA